MHRRGFTGKLVEGNFTGTRSIRIGPIVFTLTRESDGTWAATAFFGQSSGHSTAKEAVNAILDSARPVIGFVEWKTLQEAFNAAKW